MKNIFKLILCVLSILLLAYIAYCLYIISPLNKPTIVGPGMSPYYSGTDYDATYIIEGEKVTFDHGRAQYYDKSTNRTSPITRYFGNGVKTDFDNDGRTDDAFIITQEGGGSGTFYYFVARLNKATGPVGSQALFIGDRIAPQSTELNNQNNTIIVNYADRGPKDSFTDKPSIGVSLKLMFDLRTMKFTKI